VERRGEEIFNLERRGEERRGETRERGRVPGLPHREPRGVETTNMGLSGIAPPR
jgi:hypothetical protein